MLGFIVFLIIIGTIFLKNSKGIIQIISILFFISIFALPFFLDWYENSNDNPFDYARITDVDYKAQVVDEYGSNGKVIITERLTFDIHAASKDNLFWELWRDLPEDYYDGVKVDYKVNYVKQLFDNGDELVYQESPKLYWYDNDYVDTKNGYGPGKWYHSKGPYDGSYNFECVLFYVDGLYRETVVFEIQYEMNNASLRYADASELYISLYSGETIRFLNSFKGQILFPKEKMPKNGNYDAYTYGTNSHEFPFEESTTINPGYHTFSFNLDKTDLKFSPYNQYIEFALIAHGEDKHIFTKYAPTNDYSNTEMLAKINEAQKEYEALPNKWQNIKILSFFGLLLFTLLIINKAYTIIKKIKEKYTFYEPKMKMDYFRDIPSDLDPNFAASFVFCKDKPKEKIEDGYSAIMLSLVRKGYIELERIDEGRSWTFKNIKIAIKYNDIPSKGPVGPFPKKICPACGHYNGPELRTCSTCFAPINRESDINNSEAQINASAVQESFMKIKPLTPTEELYFNLILRHSGGIDIQLETFQKKVSLDYEYTNSFIRNIKNAVKNIGLSQGYYQDSKYNKPKTDVKRKATMRTILGLLIIIFGNVISYQTRLDFAFGGFFILGIAYIGSAIYLKYSSKKLILLTQYGEDEYAKWRGLYNFLNSETLINERTVIEVVIWEQYLVYATAFGISDKVIKALQIRCPDMELSPVLRNPYYRSVHFHHTNTRSFRTATHTASYTARTGGHGGYGGGGRGGGGGGGGH